MYQRIGAGLSNWSNLFERAREDRVPRRLE